MMMIWVRKMLGLTITLGIFHSSLEILIYNLRVNFFQVRKSTRGKKETEKYKNFVATAGGKGKQREGEVVTKAVRKKGGKK